MEADDTHAVNPVHMECREMNSVVRSHRFYKFVLSPVIEKLILERSLPANQHDGLAIHE